jgi:TorA maturation chaperone TorD
MADSLRDHVDDALARAVVYRTLSIGFQEPTQGRLRQVGARDGFRVVTAALRRLNRPVGRPQLEPAVQRLAALSVPEEEALAATYWRLFGHTTRGLICACETEYGPDNGFHQPQQLADISGYYLAFGLRPAATSDARADHIACECEFMDFLNRKEALLLSNRARWSHGPETLDATENAARTFLRDHLGRFGRAFAARVASEDGHGYFGAMGHVLLAFVDAECARVGVEAGPVELAVRPDTIDETPMACGTADELIQIQRRP